MHLPISLFRSLLITMTLVALSGPATARFLSVDPAPVSPQDGANFNRYWYANNNPYKFVDPDGRLACGDLDCLSRRGPLDFQIGGALPSASGARALNAQRQGQEVVNQATARAALRTAEVIVPGLGCINNGCSVGQSILEGATILPAARMARIVGSAVETGSTIFKTMHYSSRLEAAGINAARAEAVIGKEIAAMRANMDIGADVAGRLQIDNVLVEYRARLLPDGSVNVGTIFPVKP